jgi:glycosyltransferase involved in cell wall biosynthesis
MAYLANCLTGMPYTISAHAVDIYDDTEGLPEKVTSADFVVTCTQHNRDHLQALVPAAASRIHLAYHGVDLDMFDGEVANRSGPPLIVSVGRLIPKKGFVTVIRACAALRAAGLDFRCQIIGDGPQYAELQRLIDHLGLSTTVTLMGAKTHDEVRDLLRFASVSVLCPELTHGHYGIPNVLFEAMAMRVVPLTKRLPGIAEELIDSGINGVVFESDDDLTAELRAVLINRTLRERLSRAGRHTIESRFDAARTIAPLISQLSAVCCVASRGTCVSQPAGQRPSQ